jgi:REP element-mobilizing transposase RayT
VIVFGRGPEGACVVSHARKPVVPYHVAIPEALKARQMSSFTSLNYHLIFSTKHREPLIDDSWQQRLFDYLGGILRSQNGTLVAAGGMPDYVHLLAAVSKSVAITDALRDIKANSSKWIYDEFEGQSGFAWQAGYGAFSVSFSGLDSVRHYLAGQRDHHRVRSFQEEFLEFLRRHEMEYDERYIWD